MLRGRIMSNKYPHDDKNRPGDKVITTGMYEIIDPNGKPTGEFRDCARNKTFPPTPKANETFMLNDINKKRHRK